MVHIYTGDGKGKTTAALGLALRAAGHGLYTLFIQFMKKGCRGEAVSAMLFPGLIDIEQYGREEFYIPEEEAAGLDKKEVKFSSDRNIFIKDAIEGMERAEDAFSSENYDIIVLDEIFNLLRYGFITEEMILDIIERYSGSSTEIVLTGRGATEKIMEASDIVTEMKMIKHCHEKGDSPRRGIDY